MALSLCSDHETALLEVRVDLADGFSEAGVSEVEVVFYRVIPVLLCRVAHDLFKTRVNDIDLTGAGQTLHVRRLFGDLVAHSLKELHVLFLLVFLGHTSRGHMVQVFKPLEVGNCDTTTVGKHVRHCDNTSLKELFFSHVSRWSVGTFENNLALEIVHIVHVDSLLLGTWKQDVAFELHELSSVHSRFVSGARETRQSAMFGHVQFSILHTQTVFVVNGRVVFNDTSNLRSILGEELGSPVAHVAETLDNDSLSSDTLGLKQGPLNKSVIIEKGAHAVVDAKASRFGSALDTTLVNELSGRAAFRVDVGLSIHVHISVLDPGHNLLVGAKVRAKTVDLRPNEALFGELEGVATGDSLEFK